MFSLPFLHLLSIAYTAVWWCAVGVVGVTPLLYINYATHRQLRVHPFALLMPIAAAGSGVYLPAQSSSLIIIGMLAVRKWRLFFVHALACCIVPALLLYLQCRRHRDLGILLSTQTHTVHAVVQDLEPWPRHTDGVVATLAVSHIDYQPCTTTIRCYLYRNPHFTVGDALCIYRCQTARLGENTAHFEAYSIREGITGSIFAPFLSHRILSHNAFTHWFSTWRTHHRATLYSALKEQLTPQTFTFIAALFFGNKNHLDYPLVRRSFASWGLSHYLARSGLHISLIIMLLASFFCLVPCSLWFTFCSISLFLGWYWVASWGSISFARALILWFLCAGGSAQRRNPQPLYLLALIALGTMLLAPSNTLCLDFQLSFTLTGVLLARSLWRATSSPALLHLKEEIE